MARIDAADSRNFAPRSVEGSGRRKFESAHSNLVQLSLCWRRKRSPSRAKKPCSQGV
jgi:hypothetical protein